MRRLALTGALILAVSACGNDPNRNDPLRIAEIFQSGEPAPQATPQQMARAALSQLKEPVMLAELDDGARVALLVPLGQNGSVRTWTTVDRQTISVRAGRVVATRGLGADLMSSSAPRPGQGGRYALATLNAAHEPVRIGVECRTTSSGAKTLVLASGERLSVTHIVEECFAGETAFRNEFWRGANGQIRQSRQWLGTATGFLTLQVLRP